MSNLLMLLMSIAGGSAFCGCTGVPQVITPSHRSSLVVDQPADRRGRFTTCNGGHVLLHASRPLTCA